MKNISQYVALASLPLAAAQAGFSPPTVERCPGLKNASNVACVNHYAAVLPYPFDRASASHGADPANDTFVATSVPSDPSFALLENATFVVFDQSKGLSILGSDPKLEKVFETRNDSIHEVSQARCEASHEISRRSGHDDKRANYKLTPARHLCTYRDSM